MMIRAISNFRTWVSERRSYRWAKSLVRGGEVSQERIAAFLAQRGEMPLPTRKTEPDLSLAVVVPCYNHAPYLDAMLQSILKQTRLPEEVIFVEDRAQDGTAAFLDEIVARYEGDGPRLAVLHNDQNLGQAASLNRGVDAASTTLIMVLNDDDYLAPEAVATMKELFALHRDLFMIGGTSIHFASDRELETRLASLPRVTPSRLVLKRYPPEGVPRYRLYNDLNMTNSGCCFVKSAWETVGGYYSDKGERVVPFSDRDFQIRVNALFPVAVSLDVPLAFWRSNSSVDCGVNS